MSEATELLDSERKEPLWRIRLRLAWKSLKGNWSLFAENKIGYARAGSSSFFLH